MFCYMLVFNENLSSTGIAVRSAFIWLFIFILIKSLKAGSQKTNIKSGLSLPFLLSALIMITASEFFVTPYIMMAAGLGFLLLLVGFFLACAGLVELLRDSENNLSSTGSRERC